MAQSIVIRAPEVAGGVHRIAAEKAGLARFEGGNQKDRCIGHALFVAADEIQNRCSLFLREGHVVLAGLHIGPGRGVLGGEEEFPHLSLGDGPAGLIGTDAAAGGKNFVQGGSRTAVTGTSRGGQGNGKEDKDSFHSQKMLQLTVQR